jgi:hypothetical protein
MVVGSSCQGFGPVNNPRRRSPPLNLAAVGRVNASRSSLPARGRLAIEIAGCIRDFDLAIPAKLATLSAARALRYHVDVFCALEACSEAELDTASAHVKRFEEAVRANASGGALVQCDWWPHTNGILDARGRLKSEHVEAHKPGYPYSRHHRQMQIDNTIAQAHKLDVVGTMRRRTGRRYALVWRMRPDFVLTSAGLSLRTAHALILGDEPADEPIPGISGSAREHFGASGGVDYVVPNLCTNNGAHTDIEARHDARARRACSTARRGDARHDHATAAWPRR